MPNLISFNVDLFKTNKYNVVNRIGGSVTINLLDWFKDLNIEHMRHPYCVAGYLNSNPKLDLLWTIDGKSYINKESDSDIFLTLK